MKRLFILAVLLIVTIVGVGFYRGWFQFATGGTDEKPNATITVDPNKIREDDKKAVKKLKELGQKVKDKVEQTGGGNPSPPRP